MPDMPFQTCLIGMVGLLTYNALLADAESYFSDMDFTDFHVFLLLRRSIGRWLPVFFTDECNGLAL